MNDNQQLVTELERLIERYGGDRVADALFGETEWSIEYDKRVSERIKTGLEAGFRLFNQELKRPKWYNQV